MTKYKYGFEHTLANGVRVYVRKRWSAFELTSRIVENTPGGIEDGRKWAKAMIAKLEEKK